jgi:probable HAF family extracellular repeat protein
VLVVAILPLAACFSGDDDVRGQTTFTPLGFVAGYSTSQAVALSADGAVVVGTARTLAGNQQAFRWTAQQGLVGLGFAPTGTNSAAAAVSADGAVILVNGDSATMPPTPAAIFRWTSTGGFSRLDSPANGYFNAYLCSGGGLSGDGAVAVGTCLHINSEAFRWDGARAPVGLGQFGGGSNRTSTASAIAVDGSVIAGAGHPWLTGAVMWNASGVASILGKLTGDATANAAAVSRDGGVVVGTSYDDAQVPHGFRWTRLAGMEPLGTPPMGVVGSAAEGISGDSTSVVGWGPTATGEVALVWDARHGWRTLATVLAADHRTVVSGWQFQRATAISADGQTIAGFGTNPQGQTEAWIVRLRN